MRLSVGQKVFGIAIFLLVVMVAAAGVAINLTAKINNELKIVSRKHLPLGNVVSRINVRILKQGIILQRVMTQTENDSRKVNIPTERKRIKTLDADIEKEFSKAEALLSGMKASRDMKASGLLLARDIDAINNAYRAFSTTPRVFSRQARPTTTKSRRP